MLRTQTDPSLCALAQVASRSQTALLSGLGHALTQATGRQPDDLCHRKGTSHLPDHGRDRRRLTKPKSFRSGVLVQNVQTPEAVYRPPHLWTRPTLEAKHKKLKLDCPRRQTRVRHWSAGSSRGAR